MYYMKNKSETLKIHKSSKSLIFILFSFFLLTFFVFIPNIVSAIPSLSVSATTPYNTTPGGTVSFAYVPTTTGTGGTECRLLDNTQTPLTTTYQSASPISQTVPNSVGSFGYYVQCRDKVTPTVTAISSLITVNTIQTAVNTNLVFHGVYSVGSYSVTNFAHLAELKGVINTYDLIYRTDLNAQQLANELKNNNTTVNLHLNFINMFAEGEKLITNENGALDDYLETMKIKLSRDSDLINYVSFIDLSEEWYGAVTFTDTNKIAGWKIFEGKTVDERKIILRSKLESTITTIKKYFPNIQVKIVDYYWGSEWVPPTNLDVVGVDSYFESTSDLCDTEQRAIFDSTVFNVVNTAKSISSGKKLYLVGNAFTDSRRRPLSACQTQWYYDLAGTTGAVGLDWYLYTSDTSPVFPGFRENFPEQRAKIRLEGAKIVSQNNPQYFRNMLPKGSLESTNNGVFTGWAFDPDHKGNPLTIKVYNGGKIGSGTLVRTITTDVPRSDINSKYGLTGNHGFSFTLPTNVDPQSVYIYAIDPDDSSGYSNFPISPIATVGININSVVVGGTIGISWDKIPAPTNADWIGLYLSPAVGDTNSSGGYAYVDWSYARPSSSGTSCSKNTISPTSNVIPLISGFCLFTIPASAVPGTTYELRLFSGGNDRIKLGTSNAFTVSSAALPTLSVSASTPYNNILPGANVSFTYTPTTSSGGTECRLLNDVQAPLTSYQASSPIIHPAPNGALSTGYDYYVQCRNTTTTTVTATSNLIKVYTVNPVNPTIQTTATSIRAGDITTVSWSGIPAPTAIDTIGLYSSPSTDIYTEYSYTRPTAGPCLQTSTGPSTSGSCSFTIPTSAVPGTTYEFRLFSNRGAVRLDTSNIFTVIPSSTFREVWLSPTAGGTNAGTQANPYDASTQTKFDDIITSLGTNPITIHLLPGTYNTYNGITIRNGWKILGAGIDATIIKYNGPADTGTNYDFGVISSFMLGDDSASNMRVADLTVDAGGVPGDERRIMGVVLRGKDNNIVERVRVTKASSGDGTYETFIIWVGGSGDWNNTGNVIRDSVVDNCRGPYCSALTISKDVTKNYSNVGGIIEGNRVYGGEIGITTWTTTDLIVRNNYVENANYGLNVDSGKNYDTLVSSNTFNANKYALVLGGAGITTGGIFYPYAFDGFVIENNDFTTSWVGFTFQGNVTNTTIRNNIISGTGTDGIDIYNSGNSGFKIQGNTFKNSFTMPGLSSVSRCIFNNVDENNQPHPALTNTQSTPCGTSAPTVSVTATTPYNTTPGATVSFAYVPTTTGTGGTECRLLDNTQAPLTTTYQSASPIPQDVPNSVGTYGYYIQCRDKITPTVTAISNPIVVNTACPTNQDFVSGQCRNKPTITATGTTNGTISPSGVTSVVYGGSQTYTITPATGYNIVSLIVDGTTVAAATTYTFTNVTVNHTISATYTSSTCSNGATNPPTCTTCATGSIIINGTCTPITVSITATTPYNTTPGATVSFAYVPTTTGTGGTECILLDNTQAPLTTTYQPASPIPQDVPNSVGTFGYYVQCRDKVTPTVSAISNPIVVNTACPTNQDFVSGQCRNKPTITATGTTNGTISPSGVTSVVYGGSQTYTITPATGYNVATLIINGVSQAPATTYTFTSVTSNKTISATYAPTVTSCSEPTTRNVTVPCDLNSLNQPAISGSVTRTQTKTAFPECAFPTPVTKDNSTYLSDSCVYPTVTYTVTPSAGPNGSISPSAPQTVNSGSTKVFNINPSSGYSVNSITGCNGVLNGNIYTTGAITSNCIVSVSFWRSFNSFFQVRNSAGQITDLPSVSLPAIPAGGTSNFTKGYSFPSPGLYFVKACADQSSRTDNGSIAESNENNNCTDWISINVCPAGRIWDGSSCAENDEGGTIPLNVTRTVGGSVRTVGSDDINCGGAINKCSRMYPIGTDVVLRAVPASSYFVFVSWEGACSGSGVCSLDMSSEKNVTAIFAPRDFDYIEF